MTEAESVRGKELMCDDCGCTRWACLTKFDAQCCGSCEHPAEQTSSEGGECSNARLHGSAVTCPVCGFRGPVDRSEGGEGLSEAEVTVWSPGDAIREAVDAWCLIAPDDADLGAFTRAEVADWFFRWADSQDALPGAGLYADDDLFNGALANARELATRAESAEAALATALGRLGAVESELRQVADEHEAVMDTLVPMPHRDERESGRKAVHRIRAALASPPVVQGEGEVGARVLREAADAIESDIGTEPVLMHVVDWVDGIEYAARRLRDRADSLASDAGREV